MGGAFLLLYTNLGGSPFITPLEEVEQGFARTPAIVISLTVPGDIAGSQTFNFSGKMAEPLTIQLGIDIRPYLIGDPKGRPTKILPDKAVTERSSMTFTFADDPDAPDFDSAVFSVVSGNTFWRRLDLAQKDLVGATLEAKRGYVSGTLTSLDDFETMFKGRVEDYDFLPNGNFTIKAKDVLALNDRRAPAQISDDNLINKPPSGIGAGDTTIPVDKGSEFTDPSTLPSVDFFPAALRIDPDAEQAPPGPEDVIINKVVGSVITVQANFLKRSEEFDNLTIWQRFGIGTIVTANQGVSPFGGDPAADLIKLPSILGVVEQISDQTATGENWTFSIWLRNGGESVVDPAFVTIQLVAGATNIKKRVKINKSGWQRFEVSGSLATGTIRVQIKHDTLDTIEELLAFGAQLEKNTTTRGSYAATAGTSGADAGRGAFGTTALAFDDNRKIAEVLHYSLQLETSPSVFSGVHPVVIVRDMVNRGGVALADIDQSSFDGEFAFEEGVQFKRSGSVVIAKPRKLSQHVKEVRQQGLIDLWVSEKGKVKIRLSFRQNLPGVNTLSITDSDNIVHRSASYKGNKESRITEALVYYDVVAGETNPTKPEDFNKVQGTFNPSIIQLSGPKVKFIFSKWIFRAAEAVAVSGRLVARFGRGARLATWSFDLKDTSGIFVGEQVELDSDDVPVKSAPPAPFSAIRGKSQWQVTQKQHKRNEGIIIVTGLEASGLNYAIISPANGLEDPTSVFPDFPVATSAERQYGFIGDASNLLDGGTVDGYYIL